MVKPKEVKKAVTVVRRHLRDGEAHLALGDTVAAFASFEKAQHAAFKAKALVQHGGNYEDED